MNTALENFDIPLRFETGYLVFEKLTVEDLHRDYAAIKSNTPLIRLFMRSSWPSDNISLHKNLIDLQRHQQEFDEKEAFAFSVTSLQSGEYLGCIYLKPKCGSGIMNYFGLSAANAEVLISFWLTGSALRGGYYELLCAGLEDFLELWPFKKRRWPIHQLKELHNSL